MAEKGKPCEIYKRMCDMHREACFSPEKFTNGLNMGLPLSAYLFVFNGISNFVGYIMPNPFLYK